MRIGYARVSASDQDPEMQTAALRKASYDRTFTETVSERGAIPGLARALDVAHEGDILTT